MPAPILILAAEAAEIAAYLAPRLPDERLIALDGEAGLDAALAEGPDAAFIIHHADIPIPAYRRVIEHDGLAWLQVGGSGYEWIGDWDASRLLVTNAAGVLAPYLAETAIGAMLALNCGLIRYHHAQALRAWEPGRFSPVAGKRLAIVGAGAIGRETAVRARALGMEIVGLNRSGAPVEGLPEMRPLSDIDAVLPEVDVVSCHLRMTPDTQDFFDARRFGLMRPGALFLNSARGGCVVEEALADALASGRLAGAWCDVFRTEPLPAESPLWGLPTLLISPHCADQIDEWPLRFSDLFARNLHHLRAGEPLVNVVPR